MRIIIYRAAPYILIIGIIFIILDGLWVVNTYDLYTMYPKEAYAYLAIGIGLTIIAVLILQIRSEKVIEPVKGRDYRFFINKIWRQRDQFGNRLVVFILVIWVIIFILDSSLAFSLVQPILFVGFIGFSFLYIVQDEDEEKEDKEILPESHSVRTFLQWIDYRRHPFSIALVLLIMIVLSFMLSKHYGWVLSLETSGNPRYVMSLPVSVLLLSELAFACGFIYIIQHSNFLGIRQAQQSDYKLMLIHFFEITICGAAFLIWLIIMLIALFTK